MERLKRGKHFRRRNGKEKSKNILEGEMERKEGKEGGKGNILQRRRKERKIRKEEKACRGSHSDAAGCGELCFRFSRGVVYGGIHCGIAFRVEVGWVGRVFISVRFP